MRLNNMSVDSYGHSRRQPNSNTANYSGRRKQKRRPVPADDVGNRASHHSEEPIIDDNIGNSAFGAPSHLQSGVLAGLESPNRQRQLNRGNKQPSNRGNGRFADHPRNTQRQASRGDKPTPKHKKAPHEALRPPQNRPSYLQKAASSLKRSQDMPMNAGTSEILEQKAQKANDLIAKLFKKTGHDVGLELNSFNDGNLYGLCLFVDEKSNEKSAKFFGQVSVLFALNHLFTKMINPGGESFTNVVLVNQKEKTEFEATLSTFTLKKTAAKEPKSVEEMTNK